MKKIIKFALAAVLLLVLVVGGFLLGIYLQIFDANEINEKIELYDVPVIGEYFVRSTSNTNTEPQEDTQVKPKTETQDSKPNSSKDKSKEKGNSKPRVLMKEEIEQQMKEREAAEKKRVSKLARVYNEMKPQQAAAIMRDLEDDLSVAILQLMDESQAAKTLAAMEAEQSARLTKLLYTGMPKKVISPLDRQSRQSRSNEDAELEDIAE